MTIEPVSPVEISEQLEHDIQELNKRASRNFMRGDRAPRDVLIEHYTGIRDLCDDALRELKGTPEAVELATMTAAAEDE